MDKQDLPKLNPELRSKYVVDVRSLTRNDVIDLINYWQQGDEINGLSEAIDLLETIRD